MCVCDAVCIITTDPWFGSHKKRVIFLAMISLCLQHRGSTFYCNFILQPWRPAVVANAFDVRRNVGAKMWATFRKNLDAEKEAYIYFIKVDKIKDFTSRVHLLAIRTRKRAERKPHRRPSSSSSSTVTPKRKAPSTPAPLRKRQALPDTICARRIPTNE